MRVTYRVRPHFRKSRPIAQPFKIKLGALFALLTFCSATTFAGATHEVRLGKDFINPTNLVIQAGDWVHFNFLEGSSHFFPTHGVNAALTNQFVWPKQETLVCYYHGEVINIKVEPKEIRQQLAWATSERYKDAQLLALAAAPEIAVAVGTRSTILVSTDGLTWQKSPSPLPNETFRGVAYGKGTFVINAESGAILTSNDGWNWVSGNLTAGGYRARFVNNGFHVVGRTVGTSLDGMTWERAERGPNAYSWFRDVAFGEGKYVFVQDHYLNVTSGSIDTATTFPGFQNIHYAIAYGAGRFATESGWSEDGITWNLRGAGDLGAPSYANGILFGDGAYSTDAENIFKDYMPRSATVYPERLGRFVSLDQQSALWISNPVRTVTPGEPLITLNNAFTFEQVQEAQLPALVRIRSGFNNATVFYTLDGSSPTASSDLYSGAFMLDKPATIRAVAFSDDFSKQAQSIALQAKPLHAFPLTITTEGPGVVVSPDLREFYRSNTVVNLRASADPGSHFLGWSGDFPSDDPQIWISVDKPMAIRARFGSPPRYKINILEASGGGVTPAFPQSHDFERGARVTLTANPSPGFTFLGWSGSLSGLSNPIELVMTQDFTLRPSFGAPVIINAPQNGSITVNPQKAYYQHGEIVSAVAVPNPGYRLGVWGGDLAGRTDPHATVQMLDQRTLSALFTELKPGEATLAALSSGPGQVDVTPDKGVFTLGERATVIAKPESGSLFQGWNGAVSSTNETVVVALDESKTLTAAFVRPGLTLAAAPDSLPFTLVLTSQARGTVVLERSTDLRSWVALEPLQVEKATPLRIEFPSSEGRHFFRARQVSAANP